MSKTSDALFDAAARPATSEPAEQHPAEPAAERQFTLSTMCDWSLEDLARLSLALEAALNTHIRLEAYTDRIKQVRIIPLLFEEDNPLHAEFIHYGRRSRIVDLHPKPDPAVLRAATVETYPALLGEILYEKGKRLPVLPEALRARMREVLAGVRW